MSSIGTPQLVILLNIIFVFMLCEKTMKIILTNVFKAESLKVPRFYCMCGIKRLYIATYIDVAFYWTDSVLY